MKQRIISACVGLCVLVLVLAYFNTWVLNLAISVISVIAVWEVLDIAQRHRNRVLTVAALVFSVLLPFFRVGSVVRLLPIICFLFILTLLGVLLTKHEEMHVEQVAFMSFISLLVPFALTTVLFIRDSLGALLGCGLASTSYPLKSAPTKQWKAPLAAALPRWCVRCCSPTSLWWWQPSCMGRR